MGLAVVGVAFLVGGFTEGRVVVDLRPVAGGGFAEALTGLGFTVAKGVFSELRV